MATHRNPVQLTSPQALTDRLLAEGVLSVVAAAAAEGISISPKTALRWAINGTGGARLESVRVGGRRLTSRAALRRFIAQQQREEPTPAQQTLDPRAADVVLAVHGLPREAQR
jgi:hypothetical protein